MPLYYNTASPTPTTKNTINDIAVGFGIRDFLLNLNLLPQYPQIATNINGSPRIGEPVLDTTVGTGNVLIPIGLPLETNGIIWKDLNVILNTFQNDPNVANTLEQIDYIPAISNPDFVGAIWPANSQYPTGANPQVEQYGIKGKTEVAQYREDNVTKNLYLDTASQIDMADFIGLNPLDISQQLGNYLDTFGGLNQGGTAGDQTINVIGSVLNGQGVGLGAGGSVIPNFDFKSSLAGRVLGAAGFIKDTKLGNVGAQQLALALANNAAFNVQQDILGALNIKENIYSLIKDGDFAGFRPNYKITVPSSTGGQILNGITRVLGFQIPRSYLSDDGSIFQSENGDIANIDRANAMILNTGKGQIKSLISNVIESSKVNSTTNPFRSGYVPAYKNNKGEPAVPSASTKVYAYSTEGNVDKILGNASFSVDDVIPEINYNREGLTRQSGFKSPEEDGFGPRGNTGYNIKKISDIGFTWTSTEGNAVNKINEVLDGPNFRWNDEITGDKKSLLVKTQKLFNSKGMKTLVSVEGEMNQNSSQIQTSNNNGISKGSAVLTEGNFNLNLGVVAASTPDAETTFCRSWTTLNRYDSIQKLIRNKPLYNDPTAPYRFETTNSVLDGPFVKIGPYKDEPEDPKKFMFSIENLAWSDKVKELPECEQGPGDLISGTQGRIMWFPPYDIQFSENNTVNWEETNFIGRGEPIYTYNNTKRSGQLSFKIIVDHPSYFNAFSANRKGNSASNPDDNFIASFFAGCVPADRVWSDRLTRDESNELEKVPVEVPQTRQNPTDPTAPKTMSVYYPNDIKDYVPTYEDGKCGENGPDINYEQNCDGFGCGLTAYTADITFRDVKGKTTNWPDRFDYGLNAGKISTSKVATEVDGTETFGFNDPNYSAKMIAFLNKYPWAVVNFKGFASPQGNPRSNTTLAKSRAETLRTKLLSEWGGQLTDKSNIEKRFKILEPKALTISDVPDCPVESSTNPNPPVDILPCKIARKVEISITFDAELKAQYVKSLGPLPNKKGYENYRIKTEVVNKFYTECDYFERLTEADKFVFDSIREKIRYFHPAFHSTTPEGLNSRLTFLLQCTRQGPSINEKGTGLETAAANNLAFGRAPICILRIGDFYHTKIVIDNINIGYEPLVWDLNPEGIGVQPMIANVDITFNFLGGSSLMGPISKLQNALSFNYFANTHVYDPRADYISKSKNVITQVDETTGESVEYEQYLSNASAYNIVDGISYEQYDKIRTNINTRTLESTEFPDQTQDEQIINSGPENNEQPTSNTPTSATEENDSNIIKGFSVDSYVKIDESATDDLNIGFRFSFYPVNNTIVALTKSYVANLYIEDTASREKRKISTLKIKPNSSNTILFELEGDTEVLIDSNLVKPKMLFISIATLEDTETIEFVKKTYNNNSSILKIEWISPNNQKAQCNWNKTKALDSFN